MYPSTHKGNREIKMIDSKCALTIALNDASSHFVNWQLVDVSVLRSELVGEHWEVDVRHVYAHGDCVIFPCEISLDGNTNSYSLDFVDLPLQFQYLEKQEE